MLIFGVALACISSASKALVRLEAKHFSTSYIHQYNIDGVLVVHPYYTDGYSDFNLIRASAVVNRQPTQTVFWFRCLCQAFISVRNVS